MNCTVQPFTCGTCRYGFGWPSSSKKVEVCGEFQRGRLRPVHPGDTCSRWKTSDWEMWRAEKAIDRINTPSGLLAVIEYARGKKEVS